MLKSEKISYMLINETIVSEDTNRKFTKILHENLSGVGNHSIFTITFRQLLSECNARNWNGRVYKVADMWNAFDKNPLIQNDLSHGGLPGEYGHPLIEKGQNELQRQMTIFPPNVCWMINNIHMEGNLVFGDCTTVAGGYGDMMRDRALSGVMPMASTRAIGGVDSSGNVLPGFTMITVDGVFRPSSKTAYADMSTLKVNDFKIPSGNSMSESAVPFDHTSESFKNFLLSESSSKHQINMLCDTMKLDYNSMSVNGNAVTIKRMNEDSIDTLVIPLNRLVNAEYYNLF